MNKNKGLTLVEAVIGVAIIAFMLAAVLTAYNKYIKASITVIPTIQASYLLQEGIEVSNIFRDSSWSGYIGALVPGASYYLTFNPVNSEWSAVTTPSEIDGTFYRTLVVEPVYRNANEDIVASSSSATLDPNTKEVTVTVSWKLGAATTTKQFSTYITNLFKN